MPKVFDPSLNVFMARLTSSCELDGWKLVRATRAARMPLTLKLSPQMTILGIMVAMRKGCTPHQIHVAYAGSRRNKLVAYLYGLYERPERRFMPEVLMGHPVDEEVLEEWVTL